MHPKNTRNYITSVIFSGHLLTFFVFSDSRSSVFSTSFLNEGLFKGSWFQQDTIISYLQRLNKFHHQ